MSNTTTGTSTTEGTLAGKAHPSTSKLRCWLIYKEKLAAIETMFQSLLLEPYPLDLITSSLSHLRGPSSKMGSHRTPPPLRDWATQHFTMTSWVHCLFWWEMACTWQLSPSLAVLVFRPLQCGLITSTCLTTTTFPTTTFMFLKQVQTQCQAITHFKWRTPECFTKLLWSP